MSRTRALARAGLDWAVARKIGALPEPARFAALQRAARQWAPVLGRLGIDPTPLDRPRLREEHALRRVIWTASRLGYTFDPRVTIHGQELIAEANAAHRGLLLATVHCALNGMITRAVDACGISSAALQIAPEPGINNLIVGHGGRRHDAIRVSSRTLLEMRAMWRRGAAVIATVDGPRGPRARTHVSSNSGEFFLTYSSFELAVRLDVPILFFATTMTETGDIRLEIERPLEEQPGSRDRGARLDALDRAFVAFLKRQTTAPLIVRSVPTSHPGTSR